MDIIKKFNLPAFLKGKSFSEASALIAKRFEGRNSPEDIATLNELQGRLKQAQEHVKSIQEARTKPQQAAKFSADAENGAEPLGSEPASNQLNNGGDIPQVGTGGPGVGGYMGAATGALGLANMAFGDTGIDTSGKTAAPDVPSKGASAASGAMAGAQAGMSFGPWGAAIGGVVGGVAGLVGGARKQKDAQEADYNNDLYQHNASTNSYKKGGNMYADGGDPIKDSEQFLKEYKHYKDTGRMWQNPVEFQGKGVEDPKNPLGTRGWLANTGLEEKTEPSIQNYLKSNPLSDSVRNNEFTDKKLQEEYFQKNVDNIGDDLNNRMNPANPDFSSDVKFNPTELLRYAPAAMNLAQLANLKKPEQAGFDRLGNRYNEQLVDEKGLQNTVQKGVLNNRDAILSSTGGSGSSARANLLASQLQGQKAQSQAYQSAGAENRQEKRAGQQFNLSVDQANLNQSNTEKMTNLQLDAGYQTNKSKLLSQLGNDLGGVGREELFKRYPELMGLSYGAQGQHLDSEKRKKAARKAARTV